MREWGWVNWGRAAGRSGVGSTVRGLGRADEVGRDGCEAPASEGWGEAGSVAGTHRAVNFAREIFHRHVEPHPPRLAAPEHAPRHGEHDRQCLEHVDGHAVDGLGHLLGLIGGNIQLVARRQGTLQLGDLVVLVLDHRRVGGELFFL